MYAGKSCKCNPNCTLTPWHSFCVWLVCSGSQTRMGLWNNCDISRRKIMGREAGKDKEWGNIGERQYNDEGREQGIKRGRGD